MTARHRHNSCKMNTVIAVEIQKKNSCEKLTLMSKNFYPRDAVLARVFASDVSVRLSVRTSVHTPVLCLAERKQDREMYTV